MSKKLCPNKCNPADADSWRFRLFGRCGICQGTGVIRRSQKTGGAIAAARIRKGKGRRP